MARSAPGRKSRPFPTSGARTARGATRPFALVMLFCGIFFMLTLVAMLLYPGGRVGDRDSPGYSFFRNFFSDLGQTHTHSGASNLPSLLLFCIALGAMAIGVAIFFISFARSFDSAARGAWCARIAAAGGVVAAISFLGVAATPWNLYLAAHNTFVLWAFRALLLAIAFDTVAIFLTPEITRRLAWPFVIFGMLLAAYVGLLTVGPAPNTAAGALVQATGQKIIVYASVLTIVIQSLTIVTRRGTARR